MIVVSITDLDNLKNELLNTVNKVGMGETFIKRKIVEGQIEIINKIIENAHLKMSDIEDNTYLSLGSKPSEPYKKGIILSLEKEWNPEYDQNSICECGHSYYRHFDSYENMDSVGCKYCGCYDFKIKS